MFWVLLLHHLASRVSDGEKLVSGLEMVLAVSEGVDYATPRHLEIELLASHILDTPTQIAPRLLCPHSAVNT